MYKNIKPFFMVVETPLHAGSGAELGVIDLPIQRERHTSFPKVEASELKGCIRHVFEKATKEIAVGNRHVNDLNRTETIALTFGPEVGDKHSGALGFTDARLLLFPVKSMKGVFGWITCPMVLEKFKNEIGLTNLPNIPSLPDASTAPHDSKLFITKNNGKIVLEEYTFEIKKDIDSEQVCSKFTKWLSENILPKGKDYLYWQKKIKVDVVVLSDDDFKDLVNLSTEVITRIKIDNKTGTVEKGALFTEEYMPSESVFYSCALTTPIFKNKNENKGVFTNNNNKAEEDLVMEFFTNGLPETFQLGGNKMIGKGIVRTRVWGD